MKADRSDAEWLRDFDARNQGVTEGQVLHHSGMTWRELAERLQAEVERLRRDGVSLKAFQVLQAERDDLLVEVEGLTEALERLVRPPALNLRDPANSGDLEAARYVLKRRQQKSA